MNALWLLRNAGVPVCIVAAPDRATACRIGHNLAPEVAFCDFSTRDIGTAKTNDRVVIADLRAPKPTTTSEAVEAKHVMRTPRRHRPREASPEAPMPALVAFDAMCSHFGYMPSVARCSHSPGPTRMRWAIWSAAIGCGYTQRQAAAVTGHDHASVSKTIVALESAHGSNRPWVDEKALEAYRFAEAAMRREMTGVLG